MNRISDLGFRVDKIVPKESSDIVVAFFPLDRFLTAGLKDLFLKQPALFFSPYAMVLDPKARNVLTKYVAPLFKDDADKKAFFQNLPENLVARQNDNDIADPRQKVLMNFLDHVSLNTVRGIVSGSMT